MSKDLSIAIVGGGLGGLATAAALSSRGFQVDVFERASQLGEVGAGINISPQATKALFAMGVEEGLVAAGNKSSGQLQRSMYTGERLTETFFSEGESGTLAYGAPYYVLHRADLLDVLANSVGSSRVHLGHRCTDVKEDANGVTISFANGATHRADIVIGADGIHSQVRTALYGQNEPQFSGQMVWRAFVDGAALPADVLGPHGFCGWVGKGCHIMTYYLRGTDIINITTQSDSDSWVEEGWSITGDPDEMRACFPGATPELQTLLDAVTSCSKWGLFLREPSQEWGRGRVQLIGDSAHPMLPNAGQGASQAFEDAYVLARWLDALSDDPQAALAEFRNVRIPRAHAVQRKSQANRKLIHAGDWEERKDTFRAAEQSGDTALSMNWIYSWNPETEWNARQEYPLSFSY